MSLSSSQEKKDNEAKIFATIQTITSHDSSAKLYVTNKITVNLMTRSSEMKLKINLDITDGATVDVPHKLILENGECLKFLCQGYSFLEVDKLQITKEVWAVYTPVVGYIWILEKKYLRTVPPTFWHSQNTLEWKKSLGAVLTYVHANHILFQGRNWKGSIDCISISRSSNIAGNT